MERVNTKNELKNRTENRKKNRKQIKNNKMTARRQIQMEITQSHAELKAEE